MSSLKAPLQKRIQELKASIESKITELAAYEQVLKLEGSGDTIAESPVSTTPTQTQTSIVEPAFTGSRSEFVVSILKAKAAAGASAREISDMFAAKKIKVGDNLVYNVVSQLHKQKKITKRDGRYFYAGPAVASTSQAAPVSATKHASAAPKKRRISEEGMRRIVAAAKKRWAKHRVGQKG